MTENNEQTATYDDLCGKLKSLTRSKFVIIETENGEMAMVENDFYKLPDTAKDFVQYVASAAYEHGRRDAIQQQLINLWQEARRLATSSAETACSNAATEDDDIQAHRDDALCETLKTLIPDVA